LQQEHGIALSYSWVKQALQGAGLVGRAQEAWATPQAAAAARDGGNDAAHRRQQASLVSGRSLLRSDRHSGRRHQRDLLRATGGGGIHDDGDDGTETGGRNAGSVLFAIQRSGQPFLLYGESRRAGGQDAFNAGGSGAEGAGDSNDSGVFAAGAGA